jgi:glycosyltransferase involved in cell wall biosynthesis
MEADKRSSLETVVPLSCYIRTLNEKRRIGDVIRAAYQVADEVIIVDSGSTDETRAIAASAGATVIDQPWLGNGCQKRVGEEAARHDWVLDLDADEVVTPELAHEIRAVLTGAHACQMYHLKLVTVPPFGKPWWNFKLAHRVKLYRKSVIRVPDHPAWDQFEIPADAKVGNLREPLLHYAFSGIGHILTKLNRASGVRAREARLKSYWSVVLRILFAFPFYFLKEYVQNGLIRGGVYGFAYAVTIAYGRWLRDVKMYERHRGI